MRVSKPSFRLKKSDKLYFSSDSKYLYSIGSRMNVFSVQERKEIYSENLITHENFLTLNPDNSKLCIKNTNGELVVWDTQKRSVYNKTGRIKHYNEGEDVFYSSCGKFIIDMSWSGCIQIYNSKTLIIDFLIKPPGPYSIHGAKYNSYDNTYIICYSGKHDKRSPSFVTVLSEVDILSNKVEWSYQTSKLLKYLFGFSKWCNQKILTLININRFSKISINSTGDKLALMYVSFDKGVDSRHILLIIDLASGKIERKTQLFPYMAMVKGLVWSQWSNHILITTDHLPEDPGLSFSERYEKYPPDTTNSIHVFDCTTCEIVYSKVFAGATEMVFSPCKQFIAFGSDTKGVVIHNSHINEFLEFDLL